MTQKQQFDEMLGDIRHLRLFLLEARALARENPSILENPAVKCLVEGYDKFIDGPDPQYLNCVKTASMPFETIDWFAGGAHLLEHLITTAQKTIGAAVWEQLFAATRINIVTSAKEKGFDLK